MVKNFVASLAFVGMTAFPVLAAWPAFGGSGRLDGPTDATVPVSAAKNSESTWSKLRPWQSATKAAPESEPYFGPLRPQPESTTQKIKRVLNPAKWFGVSKSKASTDTDPISITANDKSATPRLRVAMAQRAEAQGRTDDARKLLDMALAEKPRDATILREYARLEDRAGRMAEAEKLYRRAVEANPKDPSFRNDLGLCLARSGQLRESAEMLKIAVGLNPQKPLYRNNLATVLVELGDTGGAFSQLSAVHPSAAAHYNMGQLFSQRGRRAEAAQCYQTALQVDPSLQQAQSALTRLQVGNFQVAARPAATPQPAAVIPTLATPELGFGTAVGPSFPVPRNLPSVE